MRVGKTIKNKKKYSIVVEVNELLSQWALVIVTGSILLVLVCTLSPFEFSFAQGFSIQLILSRFSSNGNLSDLLRNILLFMPFGFGLACLMQRTKLGGLVLLITVVILSAGLSLTVEFLQVFLPSRTPTISDLVTNTTGGGLGFVCFRLWKAKLFTCILSLAERSKSSLSFKKLTIGFIGYFTLTCLISITLISSANLSNWDKNFPLLIGNENTGDRPWKGYVSKVDIADRAISSAEVERAFSEQSYLSNIGNSLLASYRLTGQGSYPDQTGNLPDLSWQNYAPEFPISPANSQDKTGVVLNAHHWLSTANPATFLTQKLRETSQFTLSTTVATAETSQTGPARIVSLSTDPSERNFTLGQEEADLHFRLRTLLNSKNGTNPELVVPNVFADTKLHHLIVTYDSHEFRLYIDRIQNLYSIEINPAVAIFGYLSLPVKGRFKINTDSQTITVIYNSLYYALIFIPLGSIMGIIVTILKGKSRFYILFISSGIIFPSLIIEMILATGSVRDMRLENILLSTAITAIAMLLFKLWTAPWLPAQRLPHA
ncbi:MAG: VanZ family protein [Symploca sp. SIO2E9]|nr:VanZ family protein [Symploca sp. SIO2E9]